MITLPGGIVPPPDPEYDIRPFPLATRTRKNILAHQRKPILPALMAYAAAERKKTYGVEPLSSGSIYNCMGMVFASRRASIDVDQAMFIYREDGYTTHPTNSAQVGDVAVYRLAGNITHVGFVVFVNKYDPNSFPLIRVASQWGHNGEFLHDHDKVPRDYGQLTEVWRVA